MTRSRSWIEEPASPDDILGTGADPPGAAPGAGGSGEHVANRVVFGQLLQPCAIDVMQIDALPVGGVSESLPNLLLAAKFGVHVRPHAGDVGLPEMVRHLSMFDYVALSGTTAGRRIEWIDHPHEHFTVPAACSGVGTWPRPPPAVEASSGRNRAGF